MSVENTEITEIETYFGRCRCCLSYGYLKSMWVEHKYEEETEVYGEMLIQCFALTWNNTEESMEQDQICEQCIIRLRDASEFKKVVLDSQEELLQQISAENEASIKMEHDDDESLSYQGPESEEDTADTEYTFDTGDTETYETTVIKEETEYEEIEYLEEDDNADTKDKGKEVIDTDSSLPLETQTRPKRRRRTTQPDSDERSDGAPKSKWPKRLPKMERFKTYKQYTADDFRECMEAVRNGEMKPHEASLKYNIPKKTICAKLRSDPKDVQTDNTMKPTNNNKLGQYKKILRRPSSRSEADTDEMQIIKPAIKEKKAPVKAGEDQTDSSEVNDIDKHKDNIKAILLYSNATVISGYGTVKDGYACSFCNTQKFTPAELKQHNLKVHSKIGANAIKVKYVARLSLKLDITDLKCKLCKESIDGLEELMIHLNKIHSKLIHFDINNHFLPFKFETDDFRCAKCNKEFKYFKTLLEHMSEHYRNYECSYCDRAFINKRSLNAHNYRHENFYKCHFCPKTFETRPKRGDHEKFVHRMMGMIKECAYCDERFMTLESQRSHELAVHGVKFSSSLDNSCEACNASFDTKIELINHRNRWHLKLKPHKCSSCDKMFYTKIELKCHMVTHTTKDDFKCEVCGMSYDTQSCLDQHMESHLDGRRYFCDYCDRLFLHRTAFKLHMRTNHGEIV